MNGPTLLFHSFSNWFKRHEKSNPSLFFLKWEMRKLDADTFVTSLKDGQWLGDELDHFSKRIRKKDDSNEFKSVSSVRFN